MPPRWMEWREEAFLGDIDKFQVKKVRMPPKFHGSLHLENHPQKHEELRMKIIIPIRHFY